MYRNIFENYDKFERFFAEKNVAVNSHRYSRTENKTKIVYSEILIIID